MKLLKRKMELENTCSNSENISTKCQASFNSDGNITLRNYNPINKDEDEIIILSNQETSAIIHLFSQMGALISNNRLPF